MLTASFSVTCSPMNYSSDNYKINTIFLVHVLYAQFNIICQNKQTFFGVNSIIKLVSVMDTYSVLCEV